MKLTQFKGIFAILAVMALAIGMASCSSKGPEPGDVAKKIDAKETLTQADYGAILDYCGEYSQKAQRYFDLINTQPNDSTAEYAKATSDLAALYQQYSYLDMFRSVIYNLPATSLDEENQKKVEEYAKYQAFPLPEGAGVDLTNPDVTGMIEDMPDSDSNGVIATGDGETVETNVK